MADRKQAARKFFGRWTGRGDEKSDTQTFWLELLGDVVGMTDIYANVRFEQRMLTGGWRRLRDRKSALPGLLTLDAEVERAYGLQPGVRSPGSWRICSRCTRRRPVREREPHVSRSFNVSRQTIYRALERTATVERR